MLGNDWDEILKDEFSKEYYLALREKLKEEYSSSRVFPPMDMLFNALKLTPYHAVRAVILGQDPYHNEGEAHGLAFSVPTGIRVPPSLVNIYNEIQTDLGTKKDFSCGDLTAWAKEGVLLLNTALSVRKNTPNSHAKIGWSTLTDEIIRLVSNKESPCVFFLWGNNARRKSALIDRDKHLVIESVHPSPLSAYNGFFGSKPFSRCNEFLASHGLPPIHW